MGSPADLATPPMPVDVFLAFLDGLSDDRRYELFDGAPVMMTGGTVRHFRLAGNIYSALSGIARRRGCEALAGGMLVKNPADDYFAAAPDILVRCGPISPSQRLVRDPVIVVEVLSPSTMADDRGYKFKKYMEIASVTQILFVYQDEIRVESWTRAAPEWALEVAANRADRIGLRGLDDALSLADVYPED